MSGVDPRESPFYSGPELEGLTPDDRFDLAKQFRIAARNRRIGMKMGDERELREERLPLWAIGLGMAFIFSGLSLAVRVLESFR